MVIKDINLNILKIGDYISYGDIFGLNNLIFYGKVKKINPISLEIWVLYGVNGWWQNWNNDIPIGKLDLKEISRAKIKKISKKEFEEVNFLGKLEAI